MSYGVHNNRITSGAPLSFIARAGITGGIWLWEYPVVKYSDQPDGTVVKMVKVCECVIKSSSVACAQAALAVMLIANIVTYAEAPSPESPPKRLRALIIRTKREA
jgi:hypothetical protein